MYLLIFFMAEKVRVVWAVLCSAVLCSQCISLEPTSCFDLFYSESSSIVPWMQWYIFYSVKRASIWHFMVHQQLFWLTDPHQMLDYFALPIPLTFSVEILLNEQVMPQLTWCQSRYYPFFNGIRNRTITELLHDDSTVSSEEAEDTNIFAAVILKWWQVNTLIRTETKLSIVKPEQKWPKLNNRSSSVVTVGILSCPPWAGVVVLVVVPDVTFFHVYSTVLLLLTSIFCLREMYSWPAIVVVAWLHSFVSDTLFLSSYENPSGKHQGHIYHRGQSLCFVIILSVC